ncbi:MAG TPA: DUF559 domain-containing protein [Acidimicrobiales bacterium]|nr:DUF559 domain-containing protein [Acidimicrobiales bacterium]
MTASFLRSALTRSEEALWRHLRPGFAGQRFESQVPLFGYVVDFYCRRLRLVIEVDGSSHDGRARLDQLREDVLRANHIRVARISSRLVVDDIERALELLRAEIRTRSLQVRRSPRQPIPAMPREWCRHGNDALLCDRCKLFDQVVRERNQTPGGDRWSVPRRPAPASPGRYSSSPWLVNRPPEAPGTISRGGY